MAITTAPAAYPRQSYAEVYLPESDGKPMAETDEHRDIMMDLLDALEEYFRANEQIYVSGNIFVYYKDETGEMQSVSPDILVVRGVPKQKRRIYNLEVEGKAPEVVIELTSLSTKKKISATNALSTPIWASRSILFLIPSGTRYVRLCAASGWRVVITCPLSERG